MTSPRVLPYVETLFEVRGVKSASVLAEEDGEVVTISEIVYDRVTVLGKDGMREKTYEVLHPYQERLKIHYRSQVARGDALDQAEKFVVDFDGVVTQVFTDTRKTFWKIVVRSEDGTEREYETPHENRRPRVAVGTMVKRGDEMCEGDLDLRKFHQLMGDLPTQLYITRTIQEIYESQNVDTNAKHIEVITKQMIRFVEITDPGELEGFYEGDLLDRIEYQKIVEDMKKEGKKAPTGKSLLQGISKSSLSTESFLAAASFQETTRVLTEAAIEGKEDKLRGLKENVIIGGLIPVGTGRAAVEIEETAVEAVFSSMELPAVPEKGEKSVF